jgi:hypothetical protein
MKYIKIVNFKCKCGCEEYITINFDPVVCICEECGEQVNEDEYKIEVVEE